MFRQPGPFSVIADAIAHRLTVPKADPMLQFITGALPALPALLQALKPPTPIDLDGPKVKQVQREYAAEEAHLRASFAEARARLVADFGPRLDQARAADELQDGSDEADAAE
jgi:hypothetical protein